MKIASQKKALASLLTLVALGGCDNAERVTTNTVLANSNCKSVVEPIALVSLAEVASFRNSQLLNNTQTTTQTQAGDTLPLFVALSKGLQPSRGYELHLADQAKIVPPKSLEIPVYWTEPDPTKPHPLINTQPCLVVSVPNAGWLKIEAIDQNGVSLGTLKPTEISAP